MDELQEKNMTVSKWCGCGIRKDKGHPRLQLQKVAHNGHLLLS